MSMPGPELDKTYYRIGEVGRICGVKTHVLRYWESEFTGVRPAKSGRGQRLYTPANINRILEIKRLLHEERYTIEGAKSALGGKVRDPDNPERPTALDKAIEGLKKIRDMLEES